MGFSWRCHLIQKILVGNDGPCKQHIEDLEIRYRRGMVVGHKVMSRHDAKGLRADKAHSSLHDIMLLRSELKEQAYWAPKRSCPAERTAGLDGLLEHYLEKQYHTAKVKMPLVGLFLGGCLAQCFRNSHAQLIESKLKPKETELRSKV